MKPRLFAEIARNGRNSTIVAWRDVDDYDKSCWHIYHPELGQFSFHQKDGDIHKAMWGYTAKEMIFSPHKKALTTDERHELFTIDTLKSVQAIQHYATVTSEGIFVSEHEPTPTTKVKKMHPPKPMVINEREGVTPRMA